MKHAIIPVLLFVMFIAGTPLQAQPQPVHTPRLPGSMVRFVNPRAARFVTLLDSIWWGSRDMRDIHDTTIIPWAIPMMDIVNAARNGPDLNVTIDTMEHGQRTVGLSAGGWFYVFGEDSAGGGLSSIRMYRYYDNDLQLMTDAYEPGGEDRIDDTLTWIRLLATGTADAYGHVTYARTADSVHTIASMARQPGNDRQFGRTMVSVTISRAANPPSTLRGTAWNVEYPIDDPHVFERPFTIRFDSVDRYVTAPCSDCHTTTWQYQIHNIDSVQIWAAPGVCPTLCMPRSLPLRVMDIIGTTWGTIDDDTITFERNGEEIILRRMDP